jgi:membrane protein required for colicin V production
LNGYDLVIVLVLAVLAFLGFRRGLIGELVGLAAFVAALALAFRFDGRVGGGLHRLAGGLSPTLSRIVAFLVIVVAVEIAAAFVARRLNGVIARVPLLGSVNRLGGLAVGLVLALLGVWLATSALLLLPATLVPYSTTVHRSETARVLPTVTPRWDNELRAYVDNFTAGRLDRRLQRELRALTEGQTPR